MANSFYAVVLFFFVFWSSSNAETSISASKLQIINGSNETIDIFWLESDTARVPNGSVAAGKSKMISSASKENHYVTRDVSGWSVHINQSLLDSAPDLTELAIKLLQVQLDEIVVVVPATAVAELKKVPLWISPEYPATQPRAEYHPAANWLRENNRDPAMAKGVEFTNVRIFEAETRRMPNFALHELAHAFHDRVLRLGFGNPEIKAAFGVAKQSGKYDKVERRDSEGRTRLDRAYAMTSPQEYFAESTEAFFGRNDFFPYNKKELIQHDPETAKLMSDLWGVRR